MSVTDDTNDGTELIGLEKLEAMVERWDLTTETFEEPHDSDSNPFRILPSGIHFEGYNHSEECPSCDSLSSKDKGVLSDYTGMIGGGYMNVLLCKSCLSVWLKSFGWSQQRDYPENHVYHPSNR